MFSNGFLPNDEILDLSKFKKFADDNLNVAKMAKFVYGRIENTGKGENAGYQHFLLFPQCFQMDSSSGSLKVGIVWLTLSQTSPGFYVSAVQVYWKHCG